MKIIWQFTYFQQYFSHIILLVIKLISRDTEKFLSGDNCYPLIEVMSIKSRER